MKAGGGIVVKTMEKGEGGLAGLKLLVYKALQSFT